MPYFAYFVKQKDRLRKIPHLFLLDNLCRFAYTGCMITIAIRNATTDDAARLSELGATVFIQSYLYSYDQQDMDAYLDKTFGKERITNEINTETVYYYVAEADDVIVGFVKFNTFMWTPRYKGKITFEVEQLYIQKDMEGQNIGSRLITSALDVARQKQYKIVWLSVWENNNRGIRFHQQHGFMIVGDGMFQLGKTERKYLIMQQQ